MFLRAPRKGLIDSSLRRMPKAIVSGHVLLGCLAGGVLVANMAVAVTEPAASANAPAAAVREANKQTVLAFYKGFARFDFAECRKYLGPYYIQHKAKSEQVLGREIGDFEQALAEMRRRAPGAHFDVDFRVVYALDDERVIMHARTILTTGQSGTQPAPANAAPANDVAVKLRDAVHIFRLEHGKLVEHWDVTTTD